MRTPLLTCFSCVANRLLSLSLFVGLLLVSATANAQAGCVSTSGSCFDTFQGSAGQLLGAYSADWVKVRGTGSAYTTGNGTVTIDAANYAYYAYARSTSDVSQIDVRPSATKSYYAREACVRLTNGWGGYCIGFGAVSNGSYTGCFVEKAGAYLGNAGCGALSAQTNHTIAIAATGTSQVSLDVFVDGVRTGTINDSSSTLTQTQSGFALVGDGDPANTQMDNWQDYQGAPNLAPITAAAPTPAFGCPSGTGTCYDVFAGAAKMSLVQYNQAWAKAQGTAEAFLSGANSLQLNGQAYVYYSYNPSTSDISQITVSASATKQAYTREACVRIKNNYGGYCVGFGAVSNGVYAGCYIEKGGQYLGNVSCGAPSATVAHTLAIAATGTFPVVLQVYLDGVPVKALQDMLLPLSKSHPGFGMNSDGTPANSDMGSWHDYRDMATATAPTFSPAAGTYTGVQGVTLSSATPGAVIRYTTDGSTPTALSPAYTTPLSVGTSLTVKAIAMVTGQTTSAVSSAAYVINLPPAAAPTFTVPSPYSGLGVLVGIVSSTPGAQLQYCIDTTNTCTPSLPYISPVAFAYTGYIRARALASGYSASAVSSWSGTWTTVHLNTSTCPAGTQYAAYAGCVLTASGGLPPYTYKWSTTGGDGLTEGLTLNPITGAITGVVYGQGTYNVKFTVTDGTNTTASQTIAMPMKGDNTLGGCSLFPADSIWHLNVSNLPVDNSPAAPIQSYYKASALHMVFGTYLGDGGMPFLRVPYNQPNVPVSTTVFQSYFTSAPFPQYAPVESTQNAAPDGDRHTLVIQTAGGGNHCKLWELYMGAPTGTGWTAASNAMWDLESYDMLPQDEGSTDAAGLPVTPLLYNYDEVAGNCAAGAECGVVKHAGRLTLGRTLNYHVWPATAQAGGGICTGGYQDSDHLLSQSNPPSYCTDGSAMGEIHRLKSTTATPAACTGHPQAQVLITAMRNYGLMITDNGITGGVVATADSRWNDDDLACLTSLKLSDFEPVNVSSKMISVSSSQVRP